MPRFSGVNKRTPGSPKALYRRDYGEMVEIRRAGPGDTGELLTVQRAAWVTEAQLHDAPQRRTGQVLDTTSAKGAPVGVVPGSPAGFEDDRVDRADRPRVTGNVRQQRHHEQPEPIGDVVPFGEAAGEEASAAVSHVGHLAIEGRDGPEQAQPFVGCALALDATRIYWTDVDAKAIRAILR